MKKIVFASGMLSTTSICIGLILRATLGTNASGDINKILIGAGFAGLALIFTPGLLMSDSYRQKSGEEKNQLRSLMVSSFLLAIGWTFKLFHITSANELVLLGTAIFILGFLPLTFIRMYKATA